MSSDFMESPPPEAKIPTKKALENYATAYVGAYMNAVEKEKPDHLPALARMKTLATEITLLPNKCFAMIFSIADKPGVSVTERSWGEIESLVASGVSHLVTVYAHEGVTIADAISRGKRDAVRDIRAVEDSEIVRAITQLEKILKGMSTISQGNKEAARLGEAEVAKIMPLLERLKTSAPQVDMLAMIDALRNYPAQPVAVDVDSESLDLLENVVSELGTLSDVLSRVENQDKRLAELEAAMKKALSELNRSVDERIGKGLAVVLSSSDKKIDKGLAALAANKRGVVTDLPKDLEMRLARVEKAAEIAEMLATSMPDPTKSSPPEVLAEVGSRLDKVDQSVAQLQSRLTEAFSAREQSSLAVDVRIDKLEQALEKLDGALASRPELGGELVAVVAELTDNIAKINARLIRIEDFLGQLRRQRTLKQKQDAPPDTVK
jgi:hypothetical protein